MWTQQAAERFRAFLHALSGLTTMTRSTSAGVFAASRTANCAPSENPATETRPPTSPSTPVSASTVRA